MTTHARTKPMDDTIAAIKALDLGSVKSTVIRKEDGYGWSAAHADRVETAYKRFLILAARNPHVTIVPNRDIDLFWHTHILDTRQYAKDCQATFGEFQHHSPGLGLHGEKDAELQATAREATRELYLREFGEAMPDNTEEEGTGTAASWCGLQRSVEGTPGARPGQRATGNDTATAWCGLERSTDNTAPMRHGQGAVPHGAATTWCGLERRVDNTAPVRAVPHGAATAWCGLERGTGESTVQASQAMRDIH